MSKLEMYYDKENDSIQLVQNGILKHYDEYVHACNFLCNFGDSDSEDLNKFEILEVNEILQIYNNIMLDFKRNSTEKEINEYFTNIKNKSIKGELIFSKEYYLCNRAEHSINSNSTLHGVIKPKS